MCWVIHTHRTVIRARTSVGNGFGRWVIYGRWMRPKPETMRSQRKNPTRKRIHVDDRATVARRFRLMMAYRCVLFTNNLCRWWGCRISLAWLNRPACALCVISVSRHGDCRIMNPRWTIHAASRKLRFIYIYFGPTNMQITAGFAIPRDQVQTSIK